MDEALIRRLLGGVILLALAWLVAALLPPPAPDPTLDEGVVVIDLRPAEPEPSVSPAAPAVEIEASMAPVPTPVGTRVVSPEPTETPPAPPVTPRPAVRPSPTVTATPIPQRTPTPTPPAAPAPADAYWVQVGAYGTREGAEQVRASLDVAGLTARVVSVEVNGKSFHRVRIGPLDSRGAAESAQARAVLLGYANAQVTR